MRKPLCQKLDIECKAEEYEEEFRQNKGIG